MPKEPPVGVYAYGGKRRERHTTADVQASNGVIYVIDENGIHVVDTVLVPE